MSDEADAILNLEDVKLTELKIPEWGRTVYVRPMTGVERDSFEAEMMGKPLATRMANIRGRTAVRVVCNEKGERLFRDDQAEAVGKKSAGALSRILVAAQGSSGLGDEGVAAAGKDSASGQSDASGSVSPSPSV
jgi:hypothetical protein